MYNLTNVDFLATEQSCCYPPRIVDILRLNLGKTDKDEKEVKSFKTVTSTVITFILNISGTLHKYLVSLLKV